MTIQDLALELPSQTYTQLAKGDVQEAVSFVTQIIKKVLIVMIQ